MKVIVLIKHNGHTDDSLVVKPFSEENLQDTKAECEKWCNRQGTWGYFGDLPCNNGEQYGLTENDYCSYSVVDVED